MQPALSVSLIKLHKNNKQIQALNSSLPRHSSNTVKRKTLHLDHAVNKLKYSERKHMEFNIPGNYWPSLFDTLFHEIHLSNNKRNYIKVSSQYISDMFIFLHSRYR